MFTIVDVVQGYFFVEEFPSQWVSFVELEVSQKSSAFVLGLVKGHLLDIFPVVDVLLVLLVDLQTDDGVGTVVVFEFQQSPHCFGSTKVPTVDVVGDFIVTPSDIYVEVVGALGDVFVEILN